MTKSLTPKIVAALQDWVAHPNLSLSACARRNKVNRAHLSRIIHHDQRATDVIREAIGNRLGTIGAVRASGTLQRLVERAQSEYCQLDAAKHVLAISGVKPARDNEHPGSGGGIILNIVLGREAPTAEEIECARGSGIEYVQRADGAWVMTNDPAARSAPIGLPAPAPAKVESHDL